MNLLLQRLSDNGKNTIGSLHHKEVKKLLGFVVEDTFHEIKVKAQTRIPAGFYELKINKAETPLTLKHRIAYGAWFKFHIEVTGIPNYSGVYFHAGNDEGDTEGCLLTNNTVSNHWVIEKPGSSSVDATRRLYALVYPLLESGQKAFLEIRDESKLF